MAFEQLIIAEAAYQWANAGVFRRSSRKEYVKHGSVAARLYAPRLTTEERRLALKRDLKTALIAGDADKVREYLVVPLALSTTYNQDAGLAQVVDEAMIWLDTQPPAKED